MNSQTKSRLVLLLKSLMELPLGDQRPLCGPDPPSFDATLSPETRVSSKTSPSAQAAVQAVAPFVSQLASIVMPTQES